MATNVVQDRLGDLLGRVDALLDEALATIVNLVLSHRSLTLRKAGKGGKTSKEGRRPGTLARAAADSGAKAAPLRDRLAQTLRRSPRQT